MSSIQSIHVNIPFIPNLLMSLLMSPLLKVTSCLVGLGVFSAVLFVGEGGSASNGDEVGDRVTGRLRVGLGTGYDLLPIGLQLSIGII